MESHEIRDSLRQADRSEAAPWIDYPPTPRWYPIATGVWAAALTVAFTALEDGLRLLVLLALIGAELAFVRWYVRYRGGVMPTGPAPREFRRAITLFGLGAVTVVGGAYLLIVTVSPWVAAGYVLVSTMAVIAWYEHAYADAARRTRKRLA